MPVVDVHAHVTPKRFIEAIKREGTWHGLGSDVGELDVPGYTRSISERIGEMDALGVDVQLISPNSDFYQYANELDIATTIASECNDSIAEIVESYPQRFAGLGTLPMQDIDVALRELDRVMSDLRLKGVMINDHVNGRCYDEPEFLRFFQAAERLGAVLFFHQSAGTVVHDRVNRYKLGNAIGNLTDRTITFATLVFGGVIDKYPDLKVLLAHGGGYTAFGIGRLDKVAGALESTQEEGTLRPPFERANEGKFELTRAPSTYLGQFSYDCCVYDEHALRFLIDKVGVSQIMLGTDYPAPMTLRNSIEWIRGLGSLTTTEKEAILSDNAARLLNLN